MGAVKDILMRAAEVMFPGDSARQNRFFDLAMNDPSLFNGTCAFDAIHRVSLLKGDANNTTFDQGMVLAVLNAIHKVYGDNPEPEQDKITRDWSQGTRPFKLVAIVDDDSKHVVAVIREGYVDEWVEAHQFIGTFTKTDITGMLNSIS